MTRDTSKRRPRAAITIATSEGCAREGYRPLSDRDPKRYLEQLAKLKAAGIRVPDSARRWK